MDKRQLANHLGDFVSEHGAEEAAKVRSRMLIGLAYVSAGKDAVTELEFADVPGRVTVTLTPKQKSATHYGGCT